MEVQREKLGLLLYEMAQWMQKAEEVLYKGAPLNILVCPRTWIVEGRLLREQAEQQARISLNYMFAEDCSFCRNEELRLDVARRLAHFLRVLKYKDGYGFNFSKYRTKAKP